MTRFLTTTILNCFDAFDQKYDFKRFDNRVIVSINNFTMIFNLLPNKKRVPAPIIGKDYVVCFIRNDNDIINNIGNFSNFFNP
jgi:hypothetical protein